MISFGMTTPLRRLSACALAGAAMLAASSAAATVMSFEGQRIQVQEFNLTFPPEEDTATVGEGVEFSGFGLLNFDIDISASQIMLKSNELLPAAAGFSFGFVFSDIDETIAMFDDIVVSWTGFVGDVGEAVSWSDNRITIDFDGVGANESAILTLDVTFREDRTPVIPLPATLPLALGALGALAAIGRRREA